MGCVFTTTFSGISIITTYPERGFVDYVIHHAMRMRHIVICGVPGYKIISPSCLINDTFFYKKVIENHIKIFVFYTTLTEIFLTLRIIEKDIIKELMLVFTLITRYYCQILIKHEFSRQSVRKFLNVKFHKKFVQWETSCSMQTDRCDEAKKLLLQFFEPA
jgi:hypothetical protein